MAGNKPEYDDDGRLSDNGISHQHPAVGNCLETEKIIKTAPGRISPGAARSRCSPSGGAFEIFTGCGGALLAIYDGAGSRSRPAVILASRCRYDLMRPG